MEGPPLSKGGSVRIYLTGFMGCGKTTIGRILAQKQNYPFIDLDYEIEQSSGRTIPNIFQSDGEDHFRKLEREALQSIQSDPVVVATGGGTYIHNQQWMLSNGRVIYLQVPFSELAKRVNADSSRPLWKNAEKLFAEREKAYQTAHFTVDATGSPEDIVLRTLQLL